MKYAKSIYSIHKIESKGFINKLCKENNFKVETIKEFKILLKKTQKFHKKESIQIEKIFVLIFSFLQKWVFSAKNTKQIIYF
ncbi:hypothetical protein J4459_02100 [Candidatus Woesearchaeota archaeon]|nr:hypothetical protein [Candidatus Woesearchaeota archaeon]